MRGPRLKKKNYKNWFVTKGRQLWGIRDGVFVSVEGHDAGELKKKMLASGVQELSLPEHVLVLPTGIDPQVHLRFPGQPEKEELLGGLWSALDGGFDTVVTMPNTRPFLDEPAVLRKSITEAQGIAREEGIPVRPLFTASATRGMQGMEAVDVGALARAGAIAITDDGWGVKSPEAQEELFRACAANDLVFLQHAETHGHKGVASPSAFQAREQLRPYPLTAESDMIERDISILRKVPAARYHVLHVSTARSIDCIRLAKASGLRVTAEVSPHHLFYDNTMIPPASDPRCSFFKMNPPLFSPDDRAALHTALKDGTIDFVATDHAPHELEAKKGGWTVAPFGTRGMETALPVLITLMGRLGLSLERVREIFCEKGREILPKAQRLGPSGIVFVDPTLEYKVELADLPGKSENSCFLGETLRGRVFLRIEADGSVYQFE